MAIVQIGTIYDLTDPANPVAKPGWHVDSLQPIEGAEDYLITPATPNHFFSGVEISYRYRFDNEIQANQFIGEPE